MQHKDNGKQKWSAVVTKVQNLLEFITEVDEAAVPQQPDTRRKAKETKEESKELEKLKEKNELMDSASRTPRPPQHQPPPHLLRQGLIKLGHMPSFSNLAPPQQRCSHNDLRSPQPCSQSLPPSGIEKWSWYPHGFAHASNGWIKFEPGGKLPNSLYSWPGSWAKCEENAVGEPYSTMYDLQFGKFNHIMLLTRPHDYSRIPPCQQLVLTCVGRHFTKDGSPTHGVLRATARPYNCVAELEKRDAQPAGDILAKHCQRLPDKCFQLRRTLPALDNKDAEEMEQLEEECRDLKRKLRHLETHDAKVGNYSANSHTYNVTRKGDTFRVQSSDKRVRLAL